MGFIRDTFYPSKTEIWYKITELLKSPEYAEEGFIYPPSNLDLIKDVSISPFNTWWILISTIEWKKSFSDSGNVRANPMTIYWDSVIITFILK